jgi:hypothetical protein
MTFSRNLQRTACLLVDESADALDTVRKMYVCISFGSLFCLIKSHLGLVLVNETSKSPFSLLWVSLVS